MRLQPVLPAPGEWTNADLVGLAAGMVGWTGQAPAAGGALRRAPTAVREQRCAGTAAWGRGARGRRVWLAPVAAVWACATAGTAAGDQDPIRADLPSTTVTNLAAIGTGRTSGDHGLLGYTMVLPDAAGNPAVFNPLVWRFGLRGGGADARRELVPESLVPRPTMFETLARDGIDVTVVVDPAFLDSGLTRAVLRGGQRLGRRGLADTLAAAVTAVATPAGPALAYCHHPAVDKAGHVHGPHTPPWQEAVAEVDEVLHATVVAPCLPTWRSW